MLRFINNLENPLLKYVQDDPVRPELPLEFRVEPNRFIVALVDEKPKAMVCVSLHDFVPGDVSDLGIMSDHPDIAVFYTIWSYQPGSGAALLRSAVEGIRENYPNIKRFVTLSPKTEMARRFHIKNGACVYRENPNTINYEYLNF